MLDTANINNDCIDIKSEKDTRELQIGEVKTEDIALVSGYDLVGNSRNFDGKTFIPLYLDVDYFETRSQGPILFEVTNNDFNINPKKIVVYTHNNNIFNGHRVAWIKSGDRKFKKSKFWPLWIAVIPFSLAYDIITSPMQLLYIATAGH